MKRKSDRTRRKLEADIDLVVDAAQGSLPTNCESARYLENSRYRLKEKLIAMLYRHYYVRSAK